MSDKKRFILTDHGDFYAYRRELDSLHHTLYEHRGFPERYPCLPNPELISIPGCRGSNICFHSFFYQEEDYCPHCGAASLVWPEVEANPQLDVSGGEV